MVRAIKLALILLFLSVTAWADSEQIMVQVKFSKDTPHGTYQDALYYTTDEYLAIDEKIVAKEEESRVEKWIYAIENPPPEVKPTAEEIQKQIDSIDVQKVELDNLKSELIVKKADAQK